MKHNEAHVLFGNRPLAAIPAIDLDMEHHGNMIDECLAIKLGFVIRDLQYVWISLSTNNIRKKTRIRGRTRATLQMIQQGRPSHSVAFSAKVVRDLFSLTGSEALADANFFKKLKQFKERERDRDTIVTSDMKRTVSSKDIKLPVSSMDASIPNARVTNSWGVDLVPSTPKLK